MSIDFQKEQTELVEQVHKMQKPLKGQGRKWSGFRGNTTVRIVDHNLRKHMPNGLELVLGAWVEGCPCEFDILIVDKGSKTGGKISPFAKTYKPDNVKLVIEVKAAGVFYPKKTLEDDLKRYMNRIKEYHSNISILYLTIWENRPYSEMTYKALGKETAFILESSGGIRDSEWERFIKRVQEVSGSLHRT